MESGPDEDDAGYAGTASENPGPPPQVVTQKVAAYTDKDREEADGDETYDLQAVHVTASMRRVGPKLPAKVRRRSMLVSP